MSEESSTAMPEAGRLLTWFDRHRRELPWRRDHDPYRVWLSEIMLQQTRVETVIPFYLAFLERFPTVEDLADAPIDEVLAAWSGLGYYRRARQLQKAAQAVAASGGVFPSTVSGLLELPGIGPYTAAAMASICFGIAVPVLDGNVERVLARRLAEDGDAKSASVRKRFIAAAADLLVPERPGDSNQAMMELGATICVPKNPRCLLCPVAEGCRALNAGETDLYPRARRERRSEEVSIVAVLVEDESRRTLLFRRPDDSTLLAGLWEVPWVEAATNEAALELGRRYGGRWQLGECLGTARHGITYRDITVAVHRGGVREDGALREGPEAGWFVGEEIGGLATSSLVGKILDLGGRVGRNGRSRDRRSSRRPG